MEVKNESRKIMFITSELRYGGAEKMLTSLANDLSKRNFSVTIYSYEGAQSNYPLDPKIEHIVEKNIKENYYLRRFQQARQVRKKIREQNPDLVISFLTNQNVFAIIGTLFKNTPVIISERGFPGINKGVSKIKYMLYRFANVIVFQTQGAKDHFSAKVKDKGVIIPNPVIKTIHKVSDSFENRNNEISHVGRLEIKQKRQDLLLRAYSKVNKIIDAPKLIIYGDGEDLSKLEALALELGVENKVVFKGKFDNISEFIVKSKFFVLTSDYEGIPNALIEAMEVGLPVISTDCSPGGAKLLIKDGINGLLVPTNDIDMLADAMFSMINDPHLSDNMGKKAMEISDEFSEKIIFDAWDDLIKRTLV